MLTIRLETFCLTSPTKTMSWYPILRQNETEMNKSLDFTKDSTSEAEMEIFNLKKKVTTLGRHVKTLEDISPNQTTANEEDSPRSAMKKMSTNIDQRGQSKRNLGLLFGHENWNLMMNLMIGFRAGVKG